VEENRTLNKPRVTGNAQLSAQRTDNGAGFLLNNTQAGFSVGAGLILPLYSGGNIQRQVETARVAAMQAQTRVDNQRSLVETELANQFAALEIQRQLTRAGRGKPQNCPRKSVGKHRKVPGRYYQRTRTANRTEHAGTIAGTQRPRALQPENRRAAHQIAFRGTSVTFKELVHDFATGRKS
jgi:hypothetical protein